MYPLLALSLLQSATPCANGFQRYPDGNGFCLPDRAVAFLVCAKDLGGNQLQIETVEIKGGTEVRLRASGEAKGLIAGGKGEAALVIKPGDDARAVRQVFSPLTLQKCSEQVDKAFGRGRPNIASQSAPETYRRCYERDNCAPPAAVESCVLAYDGDNQENLVVDNTASRPIVFGSWKNEECKTRGEGWYVEKGSCGKGTGTRFKRCKYVLVREGSARKR